MPSKLLRTDFVAAFKKRIADAQGVRIASAWMTESKALDALLEHECDLRAIIGISGNATTPTSLRSLVSRFGPESLRIADPPHLFHPKLILFHSGQDPTVAWIGSANFTASGTGANTELMFETDDGAAVVAMEKWFDEQWQRFEGTERLLSMYEQDWEKRGPTVGDSSGREVSPLPPGATIRLYPRPRRKGGNLRGKIEYGPDDHREYRSAADGLRQLLLRLSERRGDEFLEACRSNPAFKRKARYFVGKGRNEDEARSRNLSCRAEISVTELLAVEKSDWKWWLSEDSTTEAKWMMFKGAVEVANGSFEDGLVLKDEKLTSWPDDVIQ